MATGVTWGCYHNVAASLSGATIMAEKPGHLYQTKITLSGTRPPVWRRFLVPGNTTLLKLHDILQVVMGWRDAHLHQFLIDGQCYGDPEDDEWGDLRIRPEARYRLDQVVPAAGARFRYECDFGDGWQHILSVEEIHPPQPGAQAPRCLAGKRARPEAWACPTARYAALGCQLANNSMTDAVAIPWPMHIVCSP